VRVWGEWWLEGVHQLAGYSWRRPGVLVSAGTWKAVAVQEDLLEIEYLGVGRLEKDPFDLAGSVQEDLLEVGHLEKDPFGPVVTSKSAGSCLDDLAVAAPCAGSSNVEGFDTWGHHTYWSCLGVPAACSYLEKVAHQSRLYYVGWAGLNPSVLGGSMQGTAQAHHTDHQD